MSSSKSVSAQPSTQRARCASSSARSASGRQATDATRHGRHLLPTSSSTWRSSCWPSLPSASASAPGATATPGASSVAETHTLAPPCPLLGKPAASCTHDASLGDASVARTHEARRRARRNAPSILQLSGDGSTQCLRHMPLTPPHARKHCSIVAWRGGVINEACVQNSGLVHSRVQASTTLLQWSDILVRGATCVRACRGLVTAWQ